MFLTTRRRGAVMSYIKNYYHEELAKEPTLKEEPCELVDGKICDMCEGQKSRDCGRAYSNRS